MPGFYRSQIFYKVYKTYILAEVIDMLQKVCYNDIKRIKEDI